MRKVIAAAALVASFFSYAAHAVSVAESGDAGETLASAQTFNDKAASISGVLTELGSKSTPVDDIDMYKLYISNTSGFGVHVSQGLSDNGDGQLFLFDSLGQLLASNDDSPNSLNPAFSPGVLSGQPEGFYFLGYSLFNTDPQFTGGVLSGRTRSPGPYQTGAYTISFYGVPEPATWLLMIAGLGAVGAAMRRKGAARASCAR